MTKVLIVRSSAAGADSVSGQLADQLVADWGVAPRDVVLRDLDANPVPHITAKTLGALGRADALTAAESQARALSDELIGEVKAADVLVIAAPMYNFGIPSTLKAWFDHLLRAGATFTYTATGPQGFLGDKRVVVIEARGGFYADGAAAAMMDAQEPHLKAMFALVGITDVTFVRAEGLAIDAETRAAGVAAARAALPSVRLAAAA